jgi:DNA-binding response OmpR family regulator
MKAATLVPDVILLDVCMPKLDGRDVCCELKRNPETADVPVIVFSVRGDDPYLRRQVFELGAFDVFAKPVCLTALFERVDEALRPPMATVSNY